MSSVLKAEKLVYFCNNLAVNASQKPPKGGAKGLISTLGNGGTIFRLTSLVNTGAGYYRGESSPELLQKFVAAKQVGQRVYALPARTLQLTS